MQPVKHPLSTSITIHIHRRPVYPALEKRENAYTTASEQKSHYFTLSNTSDKEIC